MLLKRLCHNHFHHHGNTWRFRFGYDGMLFFDSVRGVFIGLSVRQSACPSVELFVFGPRGATRGRGSCLVEVTLGQIHINKNSVKSCSLLQCHTVQQKTRKRENLFKKWFFHQDISYSIVDGRRNDKNLINVKNAIFSDYSYGVWPHLRNEELFYLENIGNAHCGPVARPRPTYAPSLVRICPDS